MQLDKLQQGAPHRWRPGARQEPVPDARQQLLQLHGQLRLEVAPYGGQDKEEALGLREALDGQTDAGLAALREDGEEDDLRLEVLELSLDVDALQLAAHLREEPHEGREAGAVAGLDPAEDPVALLVPLLAGVNERLEERLVLLLLDDGYAELRAGFGVPDRRFGSSSSPVRVLFVTVLSCLNID